MTALRTTVARLFGGFVAENAGVPPADFVLAPTTVEETARILEFATGHGLSVLPWGGGSHGVVAGPDPDIVLLTARLDGIDWRPDDLTVVVGAGVTLDQLEGRLGERGQSAMLPEASGSATVGGVIASGTSGWRRLRFGPTRDRILEVVAATGDGRVIRGGGQVVKNVSGYDLPRLYTGSFGTLGVITRVCLKLWPRGAAAATVSVDDPGRALDQAQRPLAVLSGPGWCRVYLAGTAAEVEAQAATLGGAVTSDLVWPEPPSGELGVILRVPPADCSQAAALVSELDFVAAHGVGEVIAAGTAPASAVAEWRRWTEGRGGGLVVLRQPPDAGLDSWGAPPQTLELQRRIKAAFDPRGTMSPGRLPGGL